MYLHHLTEMTVHYYKLCEQQSTRTRNTYVAVVYTYYGVTLGAADKHLLVGHRTKSDLFWEVSSLFLVFLFFFFNITASSGREK